MELMKMKIESLHDLFVHDLKDIYDAEHRILDALPKMVDAASTAELKTAFQKHIDVTQTQASRLEQIFDMLDMDPERQSCDGMIGLLKEGEKIVHATGDPAAKDAALIGAAQKVEHYEVSAYGTLRTYAKDLGYDDIADILQQTLGEEKQTDKDLSGIAEEDVNIRAE